MQASAVIGIVLRVVRGERQGADIIPTEADLAIVRIVEAHEEAGKRCFATAWPTHYKAMIHSFEDRCAFVANQKAQNTMFAASLLILVWAK